MKLASLKIKNFRCYEDEKEFSLEDLTCIIGQNDVGKSTIIEALNAFFNDSIDKGDLCSKNAIDTVEITCAFDNIPATIVLDSSVETTAQDEYILNSNGQLEIKRIWKFGVSTSKSSFLIANHPTHENLLGILSLKNPLLKQLADDTAGIDLTGVNRAKNPPLRKAIRNAIPFDTEEIEIKIDGTIGQENNIKAIAASLKKHLPIFSLFKVDKTIDDKDKDVQDPMKQAIKETLAIPEIAKKLKEVEAAIKIESTKVADKTLEKLKEIDAKMAEKMKSDFSKLPSWSKIFDLTLLSDENVPLNKRGSGVKRLVLLSFFQAQAEKRKLEKKSPSIIYAIEEPETAQHPNHQEILINSLIDLSSNDNVQVLFTTHSANLVREIPIESLMYVSRCADNKPQITYPFNRETEETDEDILMKIIDTLGVLPNPKDKVKVIFFVEGNHDVNAFHRYSRILNEDDNSILSLADSKDIAYVISGGSALKFYIDNKYLSGLGKPEVHIYDSDIAEYINYVQRVNDDVDETKIGFNTTKPELENYLVKEAIEEAYADNDLIVIIPEITDEMDVPKEVAKCVYEVGGLVWEDLDDRKKKKKESSVKKLLNTQAIEKMTVDRIRARNGYDEMKNWLDNIKSFCG
jgi:putative ATP-dependent endonuclease of OLD family